MHRRNALLVALAVLLLVAPTVAADEVQTGNYTVELPEEELQGEVEAPRAAPAGASVGGRAEADAGNATVVGPACEGSADSLKGRCDPGGFTLSLPGAILEPHAYVKLPVMLLHNAGSSGASIQGWTATAGTPYDQETAWAMVLAATGAVAAAVLLLRFLTSLGAAVPLSTRLQRSDVLDDTTRKRIVALLRERPGLSTKQVQERLDLAWGTLTYHLRILEDHRHVVSKRYGRYRRHFVNGHEDPGDRDLLATLQHPSTARVAEAIREAPGSNQTEVGDAVGVTSGTVVYHVKRLLEVDAVEKVREGRSVAYYPTDRLQHAEM